MISVIFPKQNLIKTLILLYIDTAFYIFKIGSVIVIGRIQLDKDRFLALETENKFSIRFPTIKTKEYFLFLKTRYQVQCNLIQRHIAAACT